MAEDFDGSVAFQFVTQQGWNWKSATAPNIAIEKCPYCNKDNYHFYMECHGDDGQKQRDGLSMCMKCGKGGNLLSLKKHLGLVIAGVESSRDWSGGDRKIEPLPDLETCHEALLEDVDALDYLMNGRGFSREIIERQKLGLVSKRYFKGVGEVKALVYPYLVNGNSVFVHFRTLPTMPLSTNKVVKAFSSPTGWDVPLYNGEVLNSNPTEVFFVEGEANCISAMDHGVTSICGVPGANFKKATWIDSLDNVEKVYICYDKDKVGQRAAQVLATKIGIEKCWKIMLPDFDVITEDGTTRKGKDLNEYFTQGGGTSESFNSLKEEAVLFDVEGVASSGDAIQEFMDELEGKEGLVPKYTTGWPSLNKYIGFEDGDVIDFIGEAKQGKGGRVSTPVLTPNGWTKMGDLKVGDELVSVDGQPSFVTGVFPRGKMQMYKVVFTDGRATDVTIDHLWKVRSIHNDNGWHVYTTDSIMNEYRHTKYPGAIKNELYIPMISGDYGNGNLPFDPWMLGAMIGDGSFTLGNTPGITSNDLEIEQRFENNLGKYGLKLTKIGETKRRYTDGHIISPSKRAGQYRISSAETTGKGCNYLTNTLKELGLYGHTSESKFIPSVYLSASKEQRWELLRGLMDTDGTVGNRHGVMSYTTISPQLAKDVQYLVRSLGGMAKIGKPTKKKFRYKGELREGQPAYLISIRLPEREKAFFLQRKLDRVHPRLKQPRLTIANISPVDVDEVICISVSHPSKLYITDDFIVTHNTTTAMNVVEHMVNTYGENGIIICLEMTRARLARKYIAHKAQIEDKMPDSPDEARTLATAFRQAIPVLQAQLADRTGELYFCYPRYKTTDDIYTLIRDCIRRYGVEWIVLDNVQLLADTTPKRTGSNRTEHLSEISKSLAQIAKDYGSKIIRILQPNKAGEVDGSSQIDKDCDCKISFHRPRIITDAAAKTIFDTGAEVQVESAFDARMMATVGLSRYTSGGTAELHFDGATSTIRETGAAEIARIRSMASGNVGHMAQLQAMNILPAQPISSMEGEPVTI